LLELEVGWLIMNIRAKIKVLIADDHQATRELLGQLLGQEGFEIVLAADGDEASDRLGEGIDLAILDLKMPGRSGMDVLRELRRYYPHVPAIVISSQFSKARLLELVENAAQGYHEKPVDWPALRRQIWNILRQQESLAGRPPLSSGPGSGVPAPDERG